MQGQVRLWHILLAGFALAAVVQIVTWYLAAESQLAAALPRLIRQCENSVHAGSADNMEWTVVLMDEELHRLGF